MKKKVHKNRRDLSLQSKKPGQSSLSPAFGVRVHFVGIGGIGMCGLAELLQSSGSLVTGSDLVQNAQVQRLKKLGDSCFYRASKVQHRASRNTDSIQCRFRKQCGNSKQPRQKKIPILKRSEALGRSDEVKARFSGGWYPHGKTTTTHLLSLMFIHNKKDPTVVHRRSLSAFQIHRFF